MKKLILFAMAISLMACDKDTTKPEDAIKGTFRCREYDTQYFVTNGVESRNGSDMSDITATISESGREKGELLYSSNRRVYLKNGVVSGEVHKTPVQGTYTFDGKTLKLDYQMIKSGSNYMYFKFYSEVYIK